MSLPLRAVETTGRIHESNQLLLDTPLPMEATGRVRVIVLFEEATDWNESEWLKAASANPAFAFLNDPGEDIYTVEDGRPFHDQG